jgi:nitroimidazol reductase NimA-like FMN-containing flavoprotein (pyridoxamine 5'-phosphate oxidase superfamily)
MTTTASTSKSFRPLTEVECQQRLAEHHAGRVAWNAGDGPMLLPVSYQLHLGKVSFRTSPYGALSRLVEPTNVAFEIDEIDRESGTGWDVLVRGRAQAVTSTYTLSTLWKLEGIVPWATGTRNLFISIEPHSVSGRQVRAPFSD